VSTEGVREPRQCGALLHDIGTAAHIFRGGGDRVSDGENFRDARRFLVASEIIRGVAFRRMPPRRRRRLGTSAAEKM